MDESAPARRCRRSEADPARPGRRSEADPARRCRRAMRPRRRDWAAVALELGSPPRGAADGAERPPRGAAGARREPHAAQPRRRWPVEAARLGGRGSAVAMVEPTMFLARAGPASPPLMLTLAWTVALELSSPRRSGQIRGPGARPAAEAAGEPAADARRRPVSARRGENWRAEHDEGAVWRAKHVASSPAVAPCLLPSFSGSFSASSFFPKSGEPLPPVPHRAPRRRGGGTGLRAAAGLLGSASTSGGSAVGAARAGGRAPCHIDDGGPPLRRYLRSE